MNVYLKSAVQNLDCVIAELTETRARLAAYLPGAGPEIGTEVFAPAVAAVQTRGRKFKSKVQGRKPKVVARKESSKPEASDPVVKEAPAAVAIGTIGGKSVSTVAGAMKLAIAWLRGKEFTADDLRTALQASYGDEDWWKNASSSALAGNLSYWASNGNLTKTANGYKAARAEFFEKVEY